jgi:glycosyltransferase involved in cell wall biosynthesis
MPKVSVIIPCYNQGEYIDEAVDSVLSQTFHDIEIIIVNDGSTDGFTNEKLKNYNKPNSKVIYTANLGLSAARNNGIRISKGKYILPLDADDKIAISYIDKAVSILDNEIEIGVVTPNQVIFFGAKNGLEGNAREGGTELFIGHFNNQVSCSVFRKVAWQTCGGYDESMRDGFEDWEFWLRLTNTGLKIATIKEPLFFYRIKKESMWTSCERIKPRLIKYMVEKNMAIYQKYITEAIVSREEVILELRTQIQNQKNLLEKYDKQIQSGRYLKYNQLVTKLKNFFKSK